MNWTFMKAYIKVGLLVFWVVQSCCFLLFFPFFSFGPAVLFIRLNALTLILLKSHYTKNINPKYSQQLLFFPIHVLGFFCKHPKNPLQGRTKYTGLISNTGQNS